MLWPEPPKLSDTQSGKQPIWVSFQVKHSEWPDLHLWLSSLIRSGERSLRIREALDEAAKRARNGYRAHDNFFDNEARADRHDDHATVSSENDTHQEYSGEAEAKNRAEAAKERLNDMLEYF